MAEISSIDGIAEGNIDKVDSLVKANISNIIGYSFPELFNELFNRDNSREAFELCEKVKVDNTRDNASILYLIICLDN